MTPRWSAGRYRLFGRGTHPLFIDRDGRFGRAEGSSDVKRFPKVRLVAMTTLAVSAIFLTSVAPAAAAGSTAKQDITGCFRWGGVTYANQPVFLQYWNGATAKWVTTRQANTNASGCIRFNDIGVGYYYHLLAYKSYFELGYYYWGESPFTGVTRANDGLWTTGTTYALAYYY
jgi:hypothetical protein